ncbi:MAG: hypothetical protein IBX69_16140 [Anaerolineales bacterium]|nr:hypothetical protein [Anaerolineales bacterium]
MLFSALSASIRVPHQPMGDLAGRPYLPQPCHPYITQMLSVRLWTHFVRQSVSGFVGISQININLRGSAVIPY